VCACCARGGSLLEEAFEARTIQLRVGNREAVAPTDAFERDVALGKCPSEPRNVSLQAVTCGRGRIIAPDGVNELLDRNDLAGP
jgi:hypothetical protein